jgi:hypothetical protein
MMRAAALIEREELLAPELRRYATEPTQQAEMKVELSAIRRELRRLGFKTLVS